jgi:hypothetical protein
MTKHSPPKSGIIAERVLARLLGLTRSELRELGQAERLPWSFTAGGTGIFIARDELGAWQSAAKRRPS